MELVHRPLPMELVQRPLALDLVQRPLALEWHSHRNRSRSHSRWALAAAQSSRWPLTAVQSLYLP